MRVTKVIVIDVFCFNYIRTVAKQIQTNHKDTKVKGKLKMFRREFKNIDFYRWSPNGV